MHRQDPPHSRQTSQHKEAVCILHAEHCGWKYALADAVVAAGRRSMAVTAIGIAIGGATAIASRCAIAIGRPPIPVGVAL